MFVYRLFIILLFFVWYLPVFANNNCIYNDTSAIVKINKILISGNNITKAEIILRELTFKEAQIINEFDLDYEINRSRENLLKLPLFNFVTIDIERVGVELINIYIIVEERWYTWPEILIINNERNLNAWWENKDFSKLDYRFSVLQYNVFGLNHNIRSGISLGYTKEFYLHYQNIFLDKKQRHFINLKGKVYYRDKVFYRTYQNKRETYLSKNGYAVHGYEFEFAYNYRPEYYGNHFFSIAGLYQQAEDSLINLNPNFLGKSNTELSFLQFIYQFSFDRRNSREYPTEGYYLEGKITRQGFGILDNRAYNKTSLFANYKQFYKIVGRFYGAHSISLKKTFNSYEVYYLKKGLGYNNYLRGYEYYVMDGQDYALLKNNLKFNLVPKQIVNLNFLPLKKFQKAYYLIYLNAYFDIAYVNDKYLNDNNLNTLSNKLIYSGGFGLDFVSYYDKIIRFEYSVIKTGEHGFFIHFIAPI